MAIHAPQPSSQIVAGLVYKIDQEATNAITINFTQEQEPGLQIPSLTLYARKPDDAEIPEEVLLKNRHVPHPKYKRARNHGTVKPGYTKSHINRRLHQDNTRVS